MNGEGQEESRTVARNITVPRGLDTFVKHLVGDGLFTNYSDVVREALRNLRNDTNLQKKQRDAILKSREECRADQDSGRIRPFDTNHINEAGFDAS